MLSRSIRSAMFAAVALSGLTVGGCAQNVGDIDQTQPHRIDVSLLNDGKPWWFLQTVVESPPTAGFTFTGEPGNSASESIAGINRVVWDVQENWLIAYKNYENIIGSEVPYSASRNDNTVGAADSPYFGSPVAAYAISSHFDVERGYNPQTGEQTNVISENTTDRPWYERQYIRVDWSNNAFGGFNFLSLSEAAVSGNDVLISPLAYYPDEEDPTNPDAAEITPAYIGIVNKVSYTGELDPALTAYFGSPTYRCFLWTQQFGLGDCGPGEVKVRLSFKKVPDDNNFFPRVYTDLDVKRYGVWQQQRAVYDPERGYIEADLAANSFAVMHHIWTNDYNATNSAGQACDPTVFTDSTCAMPLNKRTPKPVVYYTSNSWPAINDPSHKLMWTHMKLLSEDYNDDMRGVAAAALRGGGTAHDPEAWLTQNNLQPSGASGYNADGTVTYPKSGLSYLSYPPDTRQTAYNNYDSNGNPVLSADDTAYDVHIRSNVTWVNTSKGGFCSTSDLDADTANGNVPGTSKANCQVCNPANQYCMGIGHLPYSVVPRMFVMCHNPVQPRKGTANGVTFDKSDDTNPASFDFSVPGDPNVCDPRPDSDRTASPLSPQLGDLRYSMLAWIQEPDQSSPGGYGAPAADPVTGQIVSAHPYIYARAVESWATYGADLVAIMSGFTQYSDFINGQVTLNYIKATQNPNPPLFSGHRLRNMLTSPAAMNRFATVQAQGNAHLRDRSSDWGVQNWLKLSSDPRLAMPGADDFVFGWAPQYASSVQSGSAQALPSGIAQALSLGSFVAPESVNTWDAPYHQTKQMFQERHYLEEDEIEPTAVRLAQYYKDKLTALAAAGKDPCNAGGAVNTSTPGYANCVWEWSRQEILGNMWRSYSLHEVGHTFGQYHNFAGSTDALNYFDPYWDIRQQNTFDTTSATTCGMEQNPNDPTNPNDQVQSNCLLLKNALIAPNGTIPGGAVLAPEYMQAPSYQSLQNGLREYEYTSIMDYNSKFNTDFQGLGKYDHACHMYEYANTVEVFDPESLTNAVMTNQDLANADQTDYPHQVADELRVPYFRHYTIYPWMISDGVNFPTKGLKTPLKQAIQESLHARKWVRFDDLLGQSSDLPSGGLTEPLALSRDGMHLSDLQNALQVPYRFCSDEYEQQEAHCFQFDEGADAYEQAEGFINAYKLGYLFNNFKRGSLNFDLADTMDFYQSRLWDRNFSLLSHIGQHFFNNEFIRWPPGTALGTINEASGQAAHFASTLGGLNHAAASIAIVQFFSNVLQTPSTDHYSFQQATGTYCGDYTCGNSGTGNGTAQDNGLGFNLQPGDSSKYDLSQYSASQYGELFFITPTVIGTWIDRLMALQALGDYNNYFINEQGGQFPFGYLFSFNDFFYKDVSRAIGAMITDDPKVGPYLAVWTENPNDPTHPPITIFRNTAAYAATSSVYAPGQLSLSQTWCPAGAPASYCVDPTTVSTPQPPEGYSIVTQPVTSGGTVTNVPTTVQRGAVYWSKLYAATMAAINFTSALDDQRYIQAMHIVKMGDTEDTSQPPPLSCADPTDTCSPGTMACENGTLCNELGSICPDNSSCVPRQYTCPKSGSACLGVCQNPASPNLATCNPVWYTQWTDLNDSNQPTYWSIRSIVNQPDLTDTTVTPVPSDYYSVGYELLKQTAIEQNGGTPAGNLSGSQLVPIFRELYYYWSYGGMPYNPYPVPQ